MAAQKYYVVWSGREPGIYDSWDECRAQVEGFTGAKYKSFPSLQAATLAFRSGAVEVLGARRPDVLPEELFRQPGGPLRKSICVDAACSGNPGDLEYQGVDTGTGARIFHIGPLKQGTNNIGEFLAIIHALAFMQQRGLHLPVYTDSRTAISWVRNKKANTKLKRTAGNRKVFQLLDRAEQWIMTNPGPFDIRKWDTGRWGEIPADFGRK